ncbi:MAG: hypothetical protein ACOCZQ_01825, partial [Nanoarchaeota archaeon]
MESELVNVFGALGAGFMVLWLILMMFAIIMVFVYVYMSFAYMSLGKKTKDPMYGLAWIPAVGPLLIANRASGMHWWPLLLMIVPMIPVVNFLSLITSPVLLVFSIIWHWNMFEKIGKPNWWAILLIVP